MGNAKQTNRCGVSLAASAMAVSSLTHKTAITMP